MSDTVRNEGLKKKGSEQENPAEDELRESEHRYRTLFEDSRDAIAVTTRDGRIIDCNQAALELFGYGRQEMLGLNFIKLHARRDEAYRFRTEVEKKGSLRDYEVRLINREGGEMECLFTVNLLKARDNSILGYQGIIRNVSDSKRAKKALEQSEERYRTLVEESFDGIFVQVGPKIEFANRRLNDMLGYEEGELVGTDHWLVYHPEYRELTRERARARMRGEDIPSHYEVRLQRKDGSSFQGEINARRVNFDGAPGVQVWVKDITERKQAEKALRQSEKRYRLLVENAFFGIFICEPSSGRFLYLNQGMCEILGYTLDEGLGLSIYDVIVERDHPLIRKQIESKAEVRLRSSMGRVLTATGKDASRIRIECNCAPITYQDQPAVQGLVKDVTENERLEGQLRQAQKMEAIGTLAGGIAHDFNNLLMGIQGNASLMLLNTAEDQPDYRRLKAVERHVRSGAELTKQLLGFARGGKYEVNATDLNILLRDSAEMFGRTRKEIAVHSTFEEGLWSVEADRGQIEHVLLNLFVNAWQAMPTGGKLFLETENMYLDEESSGLYDLPSGKYVRVSVRDTGVGINEETRQRIFDPFFTTKEMGRGTGLGLASVYGIVRNHGGAVTVQSKVGKGTRFDIFLPATEGGALPVESLPLEESQPTETILLVDDEEMILEVGAQMLAKLGYRVMKAGSGEEALETFSKTGKGIDLVILDMIMPGTGGARAYDLLKEMDPDIKVLLSSGYSIDGQATEIMNRGCNGFIQKPFDMRNLSLSIRRILDS
jgi:two-component system, cell cycle sensor histidine kinase and response regulator CckA